MNILPTREHLAASAYTEYKQDVQKMWENVCKYVFERPVALIEGAEVLYLVDLGERSEVVEEVTAYINEHPDYTARFSLALEFYLLHRIYIRLTDDTEDTDST